MDRYLTPEVSPRMRGVVEKCTFCHHRLMRAKTAAYAEDRRELEEGEYVTACTEACPAQAITFGDLNNPEHEVSKLIKHPFTFRLLERIGTEPETAPSLGARGTDAYGGARLTDVKKDGPAAEAGLEELGRFGAANLFRQGIFGHIPAQALIGSGLIGTPADGVSHRRQKVCVVPALSRGEIRHKGLKFWPGLIPHRLLEAQADTFQPPPTPAFHGIVNFLFCLLIEIGAEALALGLNLPHHHKRNIGLQ
jgi:ferredoxin